MVLSNNWLTADPIDYEYKQYLILAYKQRSYGKLLRRRLFPLYEELNYHIKFSKEFLSNKALIEESNKSIVGIDWKNMSSVFMTNISDDSLNELEDIARYGLNVFEDVYNNFIEVQYDLLKNIEILPIKESSINTPVGYISVPYNDSLNIFEYKSKKGDIYLKLTMLKEAHIKHKNLGDFYKVIVKDKIPYHETLLPLIKFKLKGFLNRQLTLFNG